MAIEPIIFDNGFAFLLLSSFYCYFQGKGVGIAIPGISRDDVTDLLVQIPPFAEQHQIVAKVDELMSLCDQLSTRLQASQTTQLNLAEALVEGALN